MLTNLFRKMSVKRTLRWKIAMTASLLAIAPVVLSGIAAYWIAAHSLMREMGSANRETMRQIQERIDNLLITTDKIVLQHAFSPVFKQFLSLSNPYEDPATFSDVMTVLTSMEVLINDVDSVYLYMKERHLIVSPSSGLTSADKLDPYVRESLADDSRPYYLLDRKTESSLPRGGSHIVTLVRKLPVSTNQSTGYLLININERAFFDVIRGMQHGNREMLIITPSQNIFSDWNKNLLKRDFQQYPFIRTLIAGGDNEALFTQRVDGEEMVINYLRSPYNGWKYVSVVPYAELTSPFRWIKQMTIAECFLLIAVSLAGAAVLSRKYGIVVQNLLELMKKIGGAQPQPQKEMDEFGLIRHYAESIQSVKHTLERQIRESMPLLRANFIQRLLTSRLDAGEVQERLAYYGITVPHSCFSVICIEVDNLRGQTEQDVNLFLYAVMDISKEIVCRHADGMASRMHDDHIAVIVNYGPEEALCPAPQGKIGQIAEEIREAITGLLNITATIGVGRPCRAIDSIHQSYKEAMEALQEQLFAGSGRVLYFDPAHRGSGKVYPLDHEQSIVNHIRLGNLEAVCQLVDEIAVFFKEREQLGHDHVRESFTQLIAASLRTVYELDPSEGPLLFSYNLYQRLARYRTIDQIAGWLKHEVYPALIRHVLIRRTRNCRESAIREALDYIHQHYDEDLSQPLMADLLSMPLAQFSLQFKEQVGMTFSDYMIAYRMEKAKELLTTTGLKVSEIAERLRYQNSQNFIRMFKKFTKTTPGEYRARHSAKSADGQIGNWL